MYSEDLERAFKTIKRAEQKAKSFLEKHGMGDEFDSIKQKNYNPDITFDIYISSFLNEMVSRVAKKTSQEHNVVHDEFCEHYLKKEE